MNKEISRLVNFYIGQKDTPLQGRVFVMDKLGADWAAGIDDWLFDLDRGYADPTKESLYSYLDEMIEDSITLFPYPDYLEYLLEGESLDTIESMRYNDQRRDRYEAIVYRQDMLAAYYS